MQPSRLVTHLLRLGIIVLMVVSNAACVTTSTYGKTFEPVSNDDVYTLKIYYGGPPPQFATNVDFQEGTDSALYKKATEFMATRPEYTGYKVLNIEHSFIPSYYEYQVRFLRE